MNRQGIPGDEGMSGAHDMPHRVVSNGRRAVLLGAAAALLAAGGPAGAQGTSAASTPPAAPPSPATPTPSAITFNDHLAVPVPANPSLGAGKDRALVLGGGGEYFAAWMLGFVHGLNTKGVAYEAPDIIIGTSAGSVMGSAIAGGHLTRLTREFDIFGRFPKLLAALVPTPQPNPSQLRALALCQSANSASPEAIQAIGRGAMASRNQPVAKLQSMIERLTGNTSWPSPKFHAVTVDCYTGERLVVSQSAQVPVSHAASASMSLPGIFGPTFIGDRLCMDGGISASSTHSDLVAGARRAVVISLTDGSPGSGPRFANIPADLGKEIRELEASGTKTMLIAANPGKVNLVSPAEIAPAMRAGYDRAMQEAEKVKAFWG